MQNFNSEFFNLIFNLAHQSSILDKLGIFLASYLPYILFFSALVLIFAEHGWRRRILFLFYLALTIVLSRGVIVEAINFFYPRPRPFEVLGFSPLVSAGGPSFPSSHATILFAIAVVIFCLNRKWGFWYLFLSFLNGLARIFTGAHWPIDVLVGALLGVASGFLVYYLIEAYLKKIKMAF
jgi:undecaprenyl-diphosphatase